MLRGASRWPALGTGRQRDPARPGIHNRRHPMTLRHALAFAPGAVRRPAAAQQPAGYKPRRRRSRRSSTPCRRPRCRSSARPARLLLVQGVRYPAIADLAAPMLRLAGLPHQPADQRPAPAAARHRLHAPDHRRRRSRPLELPEGRPLRPARSGRPTASASPSRNTTAGRHRAVARATSEPPPRRRSSRPPSSTPPTATPLDGCPTARRCSARPSPPAAASRPRRRRARPARSSRRARQGRPGAHLPGPAEEHARRGAVRLLLHVATGPRRRRHRQGHAPRQAGRLRRRADPSPDGKYSCCRAPRRPYSYLLPGHALPARRRGLGPRRQGGPHAGRAAAAGPRADRGRADRAARRSTGGRPSRRRWSGPRRSTAATRRRRCRTATAS